MNSPFWKKWLSYLTDISLEQTSSQFNTFLEVLLVNGRHQLVTKDAIYSFDDKYENFNRIFKKINWTKQDVDEVLVLGLGLGSVILLLEKFYGKKFSYTAIEIDPEICVLANKYTLSKLNSHIQIINTDAMIFLETSVQTFDLLIMDVFENATVPEIFQTKEYLQLIKSKLNAGGILLFNRMNITDQDKYENTQFELLFKEIFPEFKALNIKDNIMLINNKKFLD